MLGLLNGLVLAKSLRFLRDFEENDKNSILLLISGKGAYKEDSMKKIKEEFNATKLYELIIQIYTLYREEEIFQLHNIRNRRVTIEPGKGREINIQNDGETFFQQIKTPYTKFSGAFYQYANFTDLALLEEFNINSLIKPYFMRQSMPIIPSYLLATEMKLEEDNVSLPSKVTELREKVRKWITDVDTRNIIRKLKQANFINTLYEAFFGITKVLQNSFLQPILFVSKKEKNHYIFASLMFLVELSFVNYLISRDLHRKSFMSELISYASPISSPVVSVLKTVFKNASIIPYSFSIFVDDERIEKFTSSLDSYLSPINLYFFNTQNNNLNLDDKNELKKISKEQLNALAFKSFSQALVSLYDKKNLGKTVTPKLNILGVYYNGDIEVDEAEIEKGIAFNIKKLATLSESS